MWLGLWWRETLFLYKTGGSRSREGPQNFEKANSLARSRRIQVATAAINILIKRRKSECQWERERRTKEETIKQTSVVTGESCTIISNEEEEEEEAQLSEMCPH